MQRACSRNELGVFEKQEEGQWLRSSGEARGAGGEAGELVRGQRLRAL